MSSFDSCVNPREGIMQCMLFQEVSQEFGSQGWRVGKGTPTHSHKVNGTPMITSTCSHDSAEALHEPVSQDLIGSYLDALELVLARAERLLAALHPVVALPAAAVVDRTLVCQVRQAPALCTGLSQCPVAICRLK